MGMFDKAKHQAQQLAGKAKETTGRTLGNDEMENAGKRDQAEGEVKEAGQDVKDRVAGAAEEAKDKFQGNKGE